MSLLWQADYRFGSYDMRVLGAVLTLLRARMLQKEGHAGLAVAELQGAGDRISRSELATPVTGWLAEQLKVTEATALVGLARREEAATLLEGVDPPKHAAGGLALRRALVAVGAEPTDTRPRTCHWRTRRRPSRSTSCSCAPRSPSRNTLLPAPRTPWTEP